MKAMPFRTASQDSIKWSTPKLVLAGHEYSANELVMNWDYLQDFHVVGSLTCSIDAVVAETGLRSPDGIVAVLQVDCVSTGLRVLASEPLQDGGPQELSVEISKKSAAVELQARYGLALDLPDTDLNFNAAAYLRGSRLLTDSRVYRFPLEGEEGGFPIEAFDFDKAGLPSGAAWKLHYSADSLADPYMSSVRLQVNTGHPQSTSLLETGNPLIQSALQYSIVEQLLLTVADAAGDESFGEFEEGSVGAVLDELTHQFLNCPLDVAVSRIKADRSGVLTQLQHHLGFLHGGPN